ncbi:MAG: hypothetical protein WD118_01995 [Phycisphaeraceae bacterium]
MDITIILAAIARAVLVIFWLGLRPIRRDLKQDLETIYRQIESLKRQL